MTKITQDELKDILYRLPQASQVDADFIDLPILEESFSVYGKIVSPEGISPIRIVRFTKGWRGRNKDKWQVWELEIGND